MPALSSRLRLIGDLLLGAAFVASLIWWLAGASSGAGSLALELRSGLQQQALFREGRRVGTVQLLTRREKSGWLLEQRIDLAGQRAALIRQQLRADLSLAALSLRADLDRLGDLAGLPAHLRTELGGLGELRLSGDCRLETGTCLLLGGAGKRTLRVPVHPGRGPVLAATVYPLLARGRLGRELELNLFDPLALGSRRVTLRLESRQPLQLPSGRQLALRARRELEGQVLHLWLDAEGLPLREELPAGFRLDHEWWRSHE